MTGFSKDIVSSAVLMRAYSFEQQSSTDYQTPLSMFSWALPPAYMTDAHRCSDPRDRIFALLGMAKQTTLAVPPDYRKSVIRVIEEACMELVAESGSVDVLLDGEIHARALSRSLACEPDDGLTRSSWHIGCTHVSYGPFRSHCAGSTRLGLRAIARSA